MKNLHLFINDKFTEPYIKFVNENFDSCEHMFLITGKGIEVEIKPRENVIAITKDWKSIALLIKQIYISDKIFLHGLYDQNLVFFFFFQPWLLKKCNWIVWGGDLYYYQLRSKSAKSDIYELFRKFVIKNMGGLITHIKGDYELAKSWYGLKGKYYYSFMYPSNLFNMFDGTNAQKESLLYIQIGNSADPTNNHLEIFEKLEKYSKEQIRIICPLSYGNTEYRDQVIKEGKRIFGEKFTPITDFMPFEEYLALLAKIDVAIFNHKRQQAVGNITTLLGLGKKVYIRDDITTWDFCIDHGLYVFNANQKFDDIYEPFNESTKASNKQLMKEKFSEQKLINDWKKIFNSGV